VSLYFIASQGKHEEAGRLYKRSVAIQEKALGPHHPDLGDTLFSWGRLLKKQVRRIVIIEEIS